MSTVIPFLTAQQKADKIVGDYAARMWLAGVEIHVIDMRLKPQKHKLPVRSQQKVAA